MQRAAFDLILRSGGQTSAGSVQLSSGCDRPALQYFRLSFADFKIALKATCGFEGRAGNQFGGDSRNIFWRTETVGIPNQFPDSVSPITKKLFDTTFPAVLTI